jgi:hypothetical protein
MYLPDYETKLTSTFGKPIVRNPDCKAANCYGRGYTGILDDKEIVKIKNSLKPAIEGGQVSADIEMGKHVQCTRCYTWYTKNALALKLEENAKKGEEEDKK